MQKSREDTNISKCTYPLHHTYNYRGENYYFLNLYSQKMENFNKDNILWHSLFRRPTFLFAYDLLDASCKTCVGRDSEQLNLCTLSPPLTTLKISRISSNVSSSQDKKSLFPVDISLPYLLKMFLFPKFSHPVILFLSRGTWTAHDARCWWAMNVQSGKKDAISLILYSFINIS